MKYRLGLNHANNFLYVKSSFTTPPSVEMTKDQVKEEIVSIVSQKQGCKVQELLVSLSKESIKSSDSLLDIIDELIHENSLIGIDYTLSSMPYRTKTFLLPPCDDIKVQK